MLRSIAREKFQKKWQLDTVIKLPFKFSEIKKV
jgi:hypothetical protein